MLLYNAIKCPDGTLLVSRHQHDFQMHKQKDGREYPVDGGLLYQRIGYSDNEYTNLCAYSDDLHEKIREHFEWIRAFDKDMNKLPEPEIIKLKDTYTTERSKIKNTLERQKVYVEIVDAGLHSLGWVTKIEEVRE